MKEPILVIMAAGMGSRFGGLKQITSVDDEGHALIDFSLYDARRAGFKKVVFIIKHEIDKNFREAVGSRMEQYFDVSTNAPVKKSREKAGKPDPEQTPTADERRVGLDEIKA